MNLVVNNRGALAPTEQESKDVAAAVFALLDAASSAEEAQRLLDKHFKADPFYVVCRHGARRLRIEKHYNTGGETVEVWDSIFPAPLGQCGEAYRTAWECENDGTVAVPEGHWLFKTRHWPKGPRCLCPKHACKYGIA